MSLAAASTAAEKSSLAVDERPSRSLSVGFLAMLPLFIAAEAARWSDPSSPRNVVEALCDRVLAPFGDSLSYARWGLFALAALVAWIIATRRGVSIVGACSRVVIEGLLAACALGPLMVVLVHAFDAYLPALDVSWDPTEHPPTLGATALIFGAGAWEELFFRVGSYSFFYWLSARFAAALGSGPKFSRVLAETGGLGVSTVLFALAHFDPILRWSGLQARAWSTPFFVWLCLGGALLGIVFRWRGPGVAAWAHALFNVALWIGIDPDVIW